MLKDAVTTALVDLMAPIQVAFQASPVWRDIETKAYPPPVPDMNKKQKKPKDKGSKYPGASTAVETRLDGSVQGQKPEEVSLGPNAEEVIKKLEITQVGRDQGQ